MSDDDTHRLRADADQQLAAASTILDGMVADARTLLTYHERTEAWALMASAESTRMGAMSTPESRKVLSVLIAAALRLAELPDGG